MHGLPFVLVVAAVAVSPFRSLAVLPGLWVTAAEVPGGSRLHSGDDRLDRRADSPTDVCFRWSQQSAIVNGSLYLYGGQATTSDMQTENAWNNDFLVLDLTKTWPIDSPPLTGLPQPSGPPAVSNGYLWNSHESLYLYGGEFSSKPAVSPVPFSLWEYAISAQQWMEHSNPETSSGSGAPSNGDPVQRAAEGAGVTVVGLGRGYYFGGHLDGYTTAGWSQSIAREYLQSLLEFTFPGFSNSQVTSLQKGQTAGSDGVYRNITQGGSQSSAGFTNRADGLLIYVPGFGDQGILLALAGGTDETFTQMNNINVYDIATSSWFVQSTSGQYPNYRVNPCAVVAAAADGSSYNIYMFGGQNLIPAGQQTQYDDMWILTLPSFTWIQVDQSKQSVPPGRSGHTCNIWDSQMVMVGGYTGGNLSCDSPGIYVFDLSQLQWVQQFTALSAGPESSKEKSARLASRSTFDSTGANNPFNQQPAQIYNSTSPGGLEGSYGYDVPAAVISVIGGGPTGGATVTAPIVAPTSGPLATGKAVTYSVSQSAGATSTGGPTSSHGSGNGGNGGGGGSSSHGANIAAIVVGVICGVLVIAVCYLAFCAYLYRRQLQMYKRHVAMTQLGANDDKAQAGYDPVMAPVPNNGRHKNGGLFVTHSAGSRHNTSAGGSGPASSQEFQAGASEQIQTARRSSEAGSVEDLLAGHEPTFVGVMLHPRRSLRVINRD